MTSDFTDPDGDELTSHYAWLVNGNVVAGAGGATLDLSAVGHGDRGGRVRVEAYASDGTSNSSTTAETVTIASMAPSKGSAALIPSSPLVGASVTAQPCDFADVDGDELATSTRGSATAP